MLLYVLWRLGQIGVLIFYTFFFVFLVLRLCSVQESICCRVTGSLGSVDFLCTEIAIRRKRYRYLLSFCKQVRCKDI